MNTEELRQKIYKLKEQIPDAEVKVIFHVFTGPYKGDPKQFLAALSDREREVALYIADGLSNAEIADKLGISVKTVVNHVSSILRKLNLWDRTQVAVYVLKNLLGEGQV